MKKIQKVSVALLVLFAMCMSSVSVFAEESPTGTSKVLKAHQGYYRTVKIPACDRLILSLSTSSHAEDVTVLATIIKSDGTIIEAFDCDHVFSPGGCKIYSNLDDCTLKIFFTNHTEHDDISFILTHYPQNY